ncbi:MAG: hydroxymethylbilane synthase [Cardiobacteriaceae bacterium]|nr:hydroxymethylbilane synthase [Cardiobacteriaceae bacterium]
MSTLRIATRQSKLALWQAEHVAARLKALYPTDTIELVPMTTQGDQLLNSPLSKIGGKGLFIKELEQVMLEGRADLAVHSMKDVGANLPEGFAIAAILERENPYDAFVSSRYACLEDLPQGAKVGTCSLRRRMNLSALRPDLQLIDLRGNVQTRLQKLDDGEFDAIVLACAGLIRLGLKERIQQILPDTLSLPAVGQGAIGIECPINHPRFHDIVALNHEETALCVKTERIISHALQASCQVPLSAFATLHDAHIRLRVRLGLPDGSRLIDLDQSALRERAHDLGLELAQELIARGADEILRELA